MIWLNHTHTSGAQNHTGGYHTVFWGVKQSVGNHPNKNRRPIRNFFHQSRLGRQGKDAHRMIDVARSRNL